ncbi:proline iminopeptidase [Trametes punicea]|nr:proline iminopeptidase [Trametes punicea]
MKEGIIPFNYKGEKYETYYKVFGDLENRTRRPVIAVHGGPGLVHQVMLPLADLAASHSIPVIFYDQIGNGRSSRLRGKPAEFFTIDLFLDEFENLLAHFGIADEYDLLGHSWGGILGAELAVRRQPKGLKHLVLSDSLASVELWGKSVMQLLTTLPKEVQEGMAAGPSDRKRYREALRQFHAKYGCLVQPTPEEIEYSMDQVYGEDGDPTVANAPILAGWSIIDRLHLVNVPTFVINGRKDIAQDFVVAPFFEGIRKVKWVTLDRSSHTPFFEEDRERYMQLVSDFFRLEA